jgi:type II secretory pathway component GspD/PulD (secretin)
MKFASKFSTATLALALATSIACAQTGQPNPAPASSQDCTRNNVTACPAQVFDINNVTGTDDLYNNLEAPLRNNFQNARVSNAYSATTGHHTIIVRAVPDDLEAMRKIIADLDRPKKNYRLTYTVTEMDGGKPNGTQRYSMIMTSGQQTSLKLGNKVPIATGSFSAGGPNGSNMSPVQTQFTYIDIGMNFDATLTEMGENAMLKSSVDESSVAPVKSDVAGTQQPIVRQASLRGESLLTPGKPVMLGSVDIPGSTSRLDIEVVMQPMP